MQTVSPFLDAGWDFSCETINGTDDIWYMPENDYPRFVWELAEPPSCNATVTELSNRNIHMMDRGVVLVDFYAPWCSFCQKQAPIMDDIANQVQGHATVAKLNTDEMRDLAEKYNVTAIPTLIIFKDGTEVFRRVGLTQAPELVDAVKDIVTSPETTP
jgi:thioredoxin 1